MSYSALPRTQIPEFDQDIRMTAEQLDTELLKKFSPLDGLKRDNLAALAKKVQIRELSPQQILFKEGDTEKRTFYIVSGKAGAG